MGEWRASVASQGLKKGNIVILVRPRGRRQNERIEDFRRQGRRRVAKGQRQMTDIAEGRSGTPHGALSLVASSVRPPDRRVDPDVFFSRSELEAILSVYGRKVVEGEWRDYAIGATKEVAIFAVHRRTSEEPLFRIEKRPKLARRQGAYSVVAATGLVLKRGHDLVQVLQVFEKRALRLIDA